MRKRLIIFPVLLILFFHFQCAPTLPHNIEYFDLDKESVITIDEKLRLEIKKFYGAPYKWGGSTPSGTDCSGMIKTIYKNAAGINLPHNAHQIFQKTEKISPRQLLFGDLVFFSRNGGARATHMGLYIKSGYFVHASSSRGVILSKLQDRYYKNQFIGARRVR